MIGNSKRNYEFGDFFVDVTQRVLLRNGTHVPLTPKAFDILLFLIETRERGDPVSRDEMIETLWAGSDANADNNVIDQNIGALRKALGDSGHRDRHIKTVHKKGYRFVATVVEKEGAPIGNETTNNTANGYEFTAPAVNHLEPLDGRLNNLCVADLIKRYKRLLIVTITAISLAVLIMVLLLRKPHIHSILPPSLAANIGDQKITVLGRNFRTMGLTVTVKFPNGGSAELSGMQLQNRTHTSFDMLIDFNSNPGPYSISVNNLLGRSSDSFPIEVPPLTSPPTPVINAVWLPRLTATVGDQHVIVYGANFQAGPTATVFYPDGRSTVLSAPAAIPKHTATFLVVVINFDGHPGWWSIQVNNLNGQSSKPFRFLVE